MAISGGDHETRDEAYPTVALHMTKQEESAFVQMAIEFLEMRGYVVTLPEGAEDFIMISEFRRSLGVEINAVSMHKRLKHKNCPAFEAEFGPDGRMVKIRPTEALRIFCSQPKQDRSRGLRSVSQLVAPTGDFHHDNGS